MDRAKQIIENTTQALSDVLQVCSEFSSINDHSSSSLPQSSPGAGRTIDVRLRAFDNILQLLNTATQLGIGPKLNDLVAKNENELLPANVEVNILPSPMQPLGALKRIKMKSVAVQTSVSNRVSTSFLSI